MITFGTKICAVVLLASTCLTAHAAVHKKHNSHATSNSRPVIHKTVIVNYGLINNGVVQKTQQSSTAISTTQDNSSHQTLNQTQINGNIGTGSTNGGFTRVEGVRNESLNPVKANLAALNTLRMGQWSDSLSVFPSRQMLFKEDFSRSESMDQRWTWSENSGKINSQNHTLELSAKGPSFPVIQTLSNPFPDSGDWTASIGYRYTSSADCGTDISIVRLDRSSLPGLASLHEDNNGQILKVDGVVSSWHIAANKNWHLLTLIKQGHSVEVIIDGQVVANVDAGVAPVGFRFGSQTVESWPADWTGQQIRFVEVTTLSQR